jgi:glycopeptide antibiotics resistance protein
MTRRARSGTVEGVNEIHSTVPAAATVLPAALIVAAVVVDTARRRRTDLRTLVWRLAFVAYLALVVTVTFFPFVVSIGGPRLPWQDGVNLEPGRSFALISYKLNILMTVPLGFLLPRVTPIRNVFAVTAVGMLTSTAIELLQLAQRILLGGTRATDVDDVIANTAGTLVGVLAFHVVALVVRARNGGGRRVVRSVDSLRLPEPR